MKYYLFCYSWGCTASLASIRPILASDWLTEHSLSSDWFNSLQLNHGSSGFSQFLLIIGLSFIKGKQLLYFTRIFLVLDRFSHYFVNVFLISNECFIVIDFSLFSFIRTLNKFIVKTQMLKNWRRFCWIFSYILASQREWFIL